MDIQTTPINNHRPELRPTLKIITNFSSESETNSESDSETDINKFGKIQLEGYNLFMKKNKDYGDAYKKHGVIGILIRMGDKLDRFQNITNNQISYVNSESLRDTLIDLHNYAAMGIMELDSAEAYNKEPDTCKLKRKYDSESDSQNNNDSQDNIISKKFKSKTYSNKTYTTSYNISTRTIVCNCPGFIWRQKCSHCELLLQEIASYHS